jgi:putative aldouronate transport system substrate-binding protein
MIRKKELLVLTMVLTVSAASLFAGGSQSQAANSDPRYPITISLFSQEPSAEPPADNKIMKYIKDKLGVTFNWDILVGDIAQKRGVMIASGDYPDLIGINETHFIDAGALIPLEGLIEQYGPNIKAHYKDSWEQLKSPDGHIYYLINWGVIHGEVHSPYYGDTAFWTQKAVLKEFGYPRVTTLDEYFDMLIKYKEKYPTINGAPTIPFTILTYDWRAFCMWNPPNFLAGYPNEGYGTVDLVTHQ